MITTGLKRMSMEISMMNDPTFRAWAMKAWKKEVLKNLPSVKAARQLKAGQRESRKALAQARRSLAAQQASTKRKLATRLAEIEREFRDRREVQDRKFEELRWEVIMSQR